MIAQECCIPDSVRPNFRSLTDRQRGKPQNTAVFYERLRIVVLNRSVQSQGNASDFLTLCDSV